jgi:HK97 family phage prohead protease
LLDEARLEELLAEVTEDAPSIEVRDAAERIIRMRIVPWDKPVITRAGPEVVMRGAFDDVNPSDVVLRLEHENPPAGRGISYDNEADGAYMEFRASKTQRGDDILTLAQDGVTRGVSVGYEDTPDGIQHYRHGGKSIRVVHKGNLREVSTTWRPTWQEAEVLSVRSTEGEPNVSETPAVEPVTPPVAPAPAVDISPIMKHLETLAGSQAALTDKIAQMEERSRQEIIIPSPGVEAKKVSGGQWMEVVIKMLSGERVPEMQLRTLDDIITTDNIGVVPDAVLSEIVGVIDTRRPFLSSTRRLELPASGMSITVPVIETRPETGVQAAEKDDIASNQTSITTDSFDAVTIAGGGDLSLQLLKRSSPAFLGLYLELLTESLNKNMEIQALTALYTGDTPGGSLDPSDAAFGQAWKNGAAVGVPPDTLWLSSTGVAQFIDAKADGTNAPLYSTIQAGFTAGTGPSGTISGLRPVYVPAMDVVGDVDAIVGPSRGFAWTEDGTYTLQVDVPAKAGRDVALVTIAWFMPLYPSAFTTYQISS